jgi:hypothetical protein
MVLKACAKQEASQGDADDEESREQTIQIG